MTAYISLLVAIIGALVYLLVARPKVDELGRIAFFCGLFVFLLGVANRAVKLIE